MADSDKNQINENLSGSSKDEHSDDEHISGRSVSKKRDTYVFKKINDIMILFVIMWHILMIIVRKGRLR